MALVLPVPGAALPDIWLNLAPSARLHPPQFGAPPSLPAGLTYHLDAPLTGRRGGGMVTVRAREGHTHRSCRELVACPSRSRHEPKGRAQCYVPKRLR